MNEHYPFTLPPLPYPYDALEPHIDKKTMQVHHDTLFQGYVTRLNNALKDYPRFQSWSLERLILENDQLPQSIRTTVYNNAGGVYNHTLYFNTMTPRYRKPSATMNRKLEHFFGSYDRFAAQMLAAGLSVFGSGWAWLVCDRNGNLNIVTTKNQDTPLPKNLKPLLPLDVWEHAYFLKYLAARNEYINNWLKVINWDHVEDIMRKNCV